MANDDDHHVHFWQTNDRLAAIMEGFPDVSLGTVVAGVVDAVFTPLSSPVAGGVVVLYGSSSSCVLDDGATGYLSDDDCVAFCCVDDILHHALQAIGGGIPSKDSASPPMNTTLKRGLPGRPEEPRTGDHKVAGRRGEQTGRSATTTLRRSRGRAAPDQNKEGKKRGAFPSPPRFPVEYRERGKKLSGSGARSEQETGAPPVPSGGEKKSSAFPGAGAGGKLAEGGRAGPTVRGGATASREVQHPNEPAGRGRAGGLLRGGAAQHKALSTRMVGRLQPLPATPAEPLPATVTCCYGGGVLDGDVFVSRPVRSAVDGDGGDPPVSSPYTAKMLSPYFAFGLVTSPRLREGEVRGHDPRDPREYHRQRRWVEIDKENRSNKRRLGEISHPTYLGGDPKGRAKTSYSWTVRINAGYVVVMFKTYSDIDL